MGRVVALEGPDVVAAVRRLAPRGVDRIVDVALSANLELNAALVGNDAVIAAVASPDARPTLPFWPLLFANVTLRLLGSDDFPAHAKEAAAHELSVAAAAGAIHPRIGPVLRLDDVVDAHLAVEHGSRAGRVVLAVC